MYDPTVAKNPIIKKYNFILTQHRNLQEKLSIRKDSTQQKSFMNQSFYKKIHAVIVKLFNSMDEMIKTDPDLWQEAIRLCKDPRDYNGKKLEGKEFDLESAISNLKGFYIVETPVKKVAKPKKKAKKAEKETE